MGEFFRGWRRKIGLLTLMMACLVAAVWMFCLSNNDFIDRQISRILPSTEGGIGLFIDGDTISLVRCNEVTSTPASSLVAANSSKFIEAVPNAQPASQDGDQSPMTATPTAVSVSVVHITLTSIVDLPFWSIVLLLTLISALLLLNKPRRSTQKKINEPITIEGT